METIMQYVASLGFPIVTAVICMWYVAKQNALHKEETDKLAEAVQNSTLVIQRLVDRLDGHVTPGGGSV